MRVILAMIVAGLLSACTTSPPKTVSATPESPAVCDVRYRDLSTEWNQANYSCGTDTSIFVNPKYRALAPLEAQVAR